MATVRGHKIFMQIVELTIFRCFYSRSQVDIQTWKGLSEKVQRAIIYKISDFKVYIDCLYWKKYPMLILIHNLSV